MKRGGREVEEKSRGRGEGVGNPLDTNANQYRQTISQIDRQAGRQAGSGAGRRAVGLTVSTWGSLKCINKLKRQRGSGRGAGGSVELVDWHCLT